MKRLIQSEMYWAALVAVLITACVAFFLLQKPRITLMDAQAAINPAQTESIYLGMGCFWGAEKRMGEVPGVLKVEVGYAGGDAAKVRYQDVLDTEAALRAGRSKARNHAEVVKVTYDATRTDLAQILAAFWENHDPTQVGGQGNDLGSNYRSAIYFTNGAQRALAEQTKETYQVALRREGYGDITTEILPLRNYNRAEEVHQDYLKKNPDGYCGLGGTGVKFALAGEDASRDPRYAVPTGASLDANGQLVIYEAETCVFCKAFDKEVLAGWKSDVPFVQTWGTNAPQGWTLNKPLFATPTIVYFKQGKEVSRYTGYTGGPQKFWQWLGYQSLSDAQKKIAFEKGTEPPNLGSELDETRPGTYVDPITGAALFRSDTKFHSGTGWPSFFNPVPGALVLSQDTSEGMVRTEVKSASSGIHLGHVFDDGPPPTGKRYCINGNVLKFIPDKSTARN